MGDGDGLHYHQVLVSRELGGAGLVALNIADHLRCRGSASHVWIPGEGPAWNEATRLGLSAHCYDSAGLLSPSRVRGAIGNMRIYRKLRGPRPGLIHIHCPFHYRALRAGVKLSGLKSVVHVHLEVGQAGLRWTFQSPPDLIITCSRSLMEPVRGALPARFRERQHIEAVPNAVDVERFRPGARPEAKRRVGAPAGTSLVLMLANLAPHKGQETAVRAVAELKRRGIEVACWLAGAERDGEGEYTAHLREVISELGVQDRVRLLGFRSDASALLQAADFFLLPSTCEGLPLSILEAQATKVPVLAAPTAGIPEVITEGETGFLIPATDAGNYANRIADLLGNAGLYRYVADQAYEEVTSEYGWSTYCERIDELYRDLLTPGRRDHPRRGRVSGQSRLDVVGKE